MIGEFSVLYLVLYLAIMRTMRTMLTIARMPPVDAVYRPHVVHHTIVPPEIKAQQLRNKSKRYFAPE